eukprot:s4663_g6.t1
MPSRFEEWIQHLRRQNDIWALVYGKEWRGVRDHAIGLLEKWHMQAPHKWPLQVLADVWEELHWRFVEELKGELRKIKAMAGRESMTLTDLKFYALMPDEHGHPPLQLPRTFDLENPEGWFMTEVLESLVEQDNKLEPSLVPLEEWRSRQGRGYWDPLDPAVRMQLPRRGGLRRMKAETHESAGEKIKELRAPVTTDKAAKIKDGQDRKGGQEPAQSRGDGDEGRDGHAGGTSWKVPEEMVRVDYTAQEREFADLVKGPDSTMFQHVPQRSHPHPGRGGETAPEEAKRLLQEAQRLADGPVLSILKDSSDDLYAWASTRVANQPDIGLQQLLGEMAQYGLGDLAEEAAKILESHVDEKAGSGRRCRVGDTHWSEDGPGRAQVEIDGVAWAMYDYKEEVMMTEELAGLLGVVAPEIEKRQCVTKVLAAGHLFLETGVLPTMRMSRARHSSFVWSRPGKQPMLKD